MVLYAGPSIDDSDNDGDDANEDLGPAFDEEEELPGAWSTGALRIAAAARPAALAALCASQVAADESQSPDTSIGVEVPGTWSTGPV
ncbi:hypothetical protein MRX96_013502 [Rhipicephalus microplus]